MGAVPRWTIVSVVLGVMVGSMGVVACEPAPRECPPTISPLHGPAGDCLRFGVSTPSGPLRPAEVAAVTDLVGVRPTVNLFFEDFTAIPPDRRTRRRGRLGCRTRGHLGAVAPPRW